MTTTDHRGSFQTRMFGGEGTLSSEQTEQIAAAERVIDDGFSAALAAGVSGVPLDIRAGTSLAVTCTAIIVRLRQPATRYHGFDRRPNYCRLRISPHNAFAVGANVIAPGRETASAVAEMRGTQHPRAPTRWMRTNRCSAMRSRRTLRHSPGTITSRRRGEPSMKATTPVSAYEPGAWGSRPARVVPGGWQTPRVTG